MPEDDLTLVHRVIQSLSLTGLWPGDNSKPIKRIISRCAVFAFLLMCALQAVALALAKDDPERLFECFSLISFSGMGILKLYSLLWEQVRWMRLFKSMTNLEEEQFAHALKLSADEQTPQNVETYSAKFGRVSAILQRIYFFTCCIFIITPFTEYGLLWLFGSRPEEYPHILPGWNPLDVNSGVFYVALVMFEALAAAYCVTTHVAFDSAFIGVVVFLCGQFELLKNHCANIGRAGNSELPSKQLDETAHFEIAKCYNTHLRLVIALKELDTLLKVVLGVYIFLSSLTLCTVAVRLTSEQLSLMQILSLLQYMCGTLVQLFLFCSYGNAVHSESSIGPGEGPFCCAIWRLGPKIRRELAMLGSGMLVPRQLHAGPFNTLNLATFIQIVRAAYSYYAVVGKT